MKDPRYPGIVIIETKKLKKGADIVLPPNIIVASDYRHHYGEAIIQHGYGHYLQYKKHGALYYYMVIAPASILAAFKNNNHAWVEREANQLAHHFFKEHSKLGGKLFPL